MLQFEFYELWRCNQISEFIQKPRYNLIHNLQELFRDIFPCKLQNISNFVMYVYTDAGLYIIGSTVNGFGQCNSELDICLMISHEMVIRIQN